MHSFVESFFHDMVINFYENRFIFDQHRAKICSHVFLDTVYDVSITVYVGNINAQNSSRFSHTDLPLTTPLTTMLAYSYRTLVSNVTDIFIFKTFLQQ